MKYIRQASRQDQQEIDNLRINEFQRSGQFTLREPEKLLWSSYDDAAIILCAWDGARAVATMRGVVLHDAKQGESCIQCTVPPEVYFPALVFNATATRLEYRGQGLNQLLRYHFMKIALAGNVQSLLSPMYDGAPRMRFMEALGYRFHVPKLSWQTKLTPNAKRILGVLPHDLIPHALEQIRTRRTDTILSYPWMGQPVQIKDAMPRQASLERKF